MTKFPALAIGTIGERGPEPGDRGQPQLGEEKRQPCRVERIDTGSAAGELVFHVFGAIAHFERRLIAERTRDGIAAARAEGRKPGRKPLDPEKLQAAVTLIRSGLSPSKAARQVGLGRSTLHRSPSCQMPAASRPSVHRCSVQEILADRIEAWAAASHDRSAVRDGRLTETAVQHAAEITLAPSRDGGRAPSPAIADVDFGIG